MKKTLCFIAVLAVAVLFSGCQALDVSDSGKAVCRTLLTEYYCTCGIEGFYYHFESEEAYAAAMWAEGRFSVRDFEGDPDLGVWYCKFDPYNHLIIHGEGLWIPSFFTKTIPLLDETGVYGFFIKNQHFNDELGEWVVF